MLMTFAPYLYRAFSTLLRLLHHRDYGDSVCSLHQLRTVLGPSLIVPRSESFRLVAENQIGLFSPELKVLDTQSSSLEYDISTGLLMLI